MEAQTLNVFWVNLCNDARNAQDIVFIYEIGDTFKIRHVDKDRIKLTLEEEKPHLFCLDYDFPDRYNLQLLRQLRYEYPYIPVIMITMQHCESLAVWAFRTGVRDYLVKPLTVNSIIEVLNNLSTLAKPSLAQNRRVSRQNFIAPPLLTQ